MYLFRTGVQEIKYPRTTEQNRLRQRKNSNNLTFGKYLTFSKLKTKRFFYSFRYYKKRCIKLTVGQDRERLNKILQWSTFSLHRLLMN